MIFALNYRRVDLSSGYRPRSHPSSVDLQLPRTAVVVWYPRFILITHRHSKIGLICCYHNRLVGYPKGLKHILLFFFFKIVMGLQIKPMTPL